MKARPSSPVIDAGQQGFGLGAVAGPPRADRLRGQCIDIAKTFQKAFGMAGLNAVCPMPGFALPERGPTRLWCR